MVPMSSVRPPSAAGPRTPHAATAARPARRAARRRRRRSGSCGRWTFGFRARGVRPAAAKSAAIDHADEKEQVVDAIRVATLHRNFRYNGLMGHSPFARLRVRSRPGDRTQGWLTVGPLAIRVALGRGGIRANKREGDGGTPRGRFRLVRLWWRADRHARPRTLLPTRRITPDIAWSEDPRDRRYNRPFRRGAEAAGDR